MSVSKVYERRLDLLSHGYVKQYIHSQKMPMDIIECIETWHNNHSHPKLKFNIISLYNSIVLGCIKYRGDIS